MKITMAKKKYMNNKKKTEKFADNTKNKHTICL